MAGPVASARRRATEGYAGCLTAPASAFICQLENEVKGMVFCLFLVMAMSAVARESATELVERSVEAARANRQRMAMYLFREDVRQKQFNASGDLTGERTLTYDVLMLEGRPYHRRVAIDGRPLAPADEAMERERMDQVAAERRRNPSARSPTDRTRRVVPYDQLTRLLKTRVDGEISLNRRPCSLVIAAPKRSAKARTPDEKRLAGSRVSIWIDKATLHRVRMEVQSRHDESTVFDYARQDGDIWLIRRIAARQHQGKTVLETEQIYSNYRRFSAESEARVQDDP